MFDAPLYLYLSLAMAVFVAWDSARRKTTRLRWVVGAILAWPLIVPLWMATRPLLHGEVRRGGRAWNALKHFAVTWSILWGAHVLIAIVVGLLAWWTNQDAPDRAAGIGLVILLGVIYLALWIVPAASALGVGLWLRKPGVAEQGTDAI